MIFVPSKTTAIRSSKIYSGISQNDKHFPNIQWCYAVQDDMVSHLLNILGSGELKPSSVAGAV